MRSLCTKNLLIYLLVFLSACSKKNEAASNATGITNFQFHQGLDKTTINAAAHWIDVRVPDSIRSGVSMAPIFGLSTGAILSKEGVEQQSGITNNDFENQNVQYDVLAADRVTKQSWTVSVSNNDYSVDFGLGHFIHKEISNERTYPWYIDQGTSGTDAGVNCGPASVTMAIRWSDAAFTKTAADARAAIREDDGWWYTSDIDQYLTTYDIPHVVIPLGNTADSTASIWMHALDNQQIVMLCLDMDKIRLASNPQFRADKFYSTTPAWGHFIVIKGYKTIDNEKFMEAYDPYSFNIVNQSDNTLKGQNRYYRASDLVSATDSWWHYSFVIAKKGSTVHTDAARTALKFSDVPIGSGSHKVTW